MKVNKKTIKNLLCNITAFVLFLSAIVGLVVIMPKKQMEAEATNNVVTDTPVNLTNPNFVGSSTNYPFAPDGYKASQTVNNNDNNSSIKAGVVNVTESEYVKYAQGRPDNYILMISKLRDGGYGEFGYTTNNAINLVADSNYLISVDVYTDNDDGIANLYLKDEDDKTFAEIKNIRSQNAWNTYYFLIKTNQTTSLNLKLGMFVEGAGTAMFDNISAFKLSDNSLQDKITAFDNAKIRYNYLDKSDKVIANYNFADLKLDVVNDINANYTKTIETGADASDGQTNTAIKINTASSFVQFSTKDNFLSLKSHSIYKITLTAKAKELAGEASFKLVQTGLANGVDGKEETLKITSSSTTSTDNGYNKYTFYVQTSTLTNASFKLLVSLGAENTNTTGSLYLTSIVVSKVDYSTYNGASSTNNAKIDLTDKDKASTSEYFENGNFNTIQISNAVNPFPATPNGWSVTTGKHDQVYGVINTTDDAINSLTTNNSLNEFISPYTNKNENVLMMHNTSADELTYTSSTISLDAQTYNKISVNIQAVNSPVKLSLVNVLDSSEVELTSKTIEETGIRNWKTATFYINSGYQNLKLALKVSLNSSSWAYCFIDEASYAKLTTLNQDGFNNISEGEFSKKADLTNLFANANNGVYSTPTLFDADGNLDGYYGVIDVTLDDNTLQGNVITNEDYKLDILKSVKGNKQVLGIYSQIDTHFTYTSKLGYTLKNGEYYKLSIDVFTPSLSATGNAKVGAYLSLSSFDKCFSAISSYNEWSTYTFYINPNADVTSYLSLAMGSESDECQGKIYFGNIKFEKIQKEAYPTANQGNSIILNEISTEPEDTTTPEETTNTPTNNRAWLYAIPSILTVLAILIAVVGVMLRKVKFKKPVKKSKNEYDRNKTVSKQYYERKATTMREEKLRDLNKDLQTATASRTTYEEEYKHSLTKLRDLKLKRAPANEIAKLEKEMKKNRKLSSSVGITIRHIEDEIEYVKSDAYLISLTKKLANSGVSEENTSTESNSETNSENKKA